MSINIIPDVLKLSPTIRISKSAGRVTVDDCNGKIVFNSLYRTEKDRRALTMFLITWLKKELP